MLRKKEYNDLIRLMQNSTIAQKEKIHITGELKQITKFKKKKVIY